MLSSSVENRKNLLNLLKWKISLTFAKDCFYSNLAWRCAFWACNQLRWAMRTGLKVQLQQQVRDWFLTGMSVHLAKWSAHSLATSLPPARVCNLPDRRQSINGRPLKCRADWSIHRTSRTAPAQTPRSFDIHTQRCWFHRIFQCFKNLVHSCRKRPGRVDINSH